MDFCKAYNAADREPAGHDRPGRDHGLRGPLVHLHPQDPADAGAAPPGRRAREGLDDAGPERSARSPRPRSTEIAETKMPDLNANDLEAAKLQVAGTARSMGIKVVKQVQPAVTGTPRPAGHQPRGRQQCRQHGKKYVDATTQVRPRRSCTRRPRRSSSSRTWRRPSSTRPSSWPCGSASTPARPTRWCAAPSPCPRGTGKDVRVAVFADGDAAAEARAAGADVVGADDLVAQVEGGMLDFDVAIATPDLMAPGRQARPHARPPRPHAEPQDGHGHHRRRQGRRPSSRAAGSSTAPTATATSTCRSARSSFEPPSAGRQLPGRARRAAAGQAGVGQGPLHQARHRGLDDGPRRQGRPEPPADDHRATP